MINKQGKFFKASVEATEKLGRKGGDLCAFLWLTEHFLEETIDVNAGGVEEVDAVMFLRTQE